MFQITLPNGGRTNVPGAASRTIDMVGVNLPFTLTGISVQGSDRYAIINGEIVQEGNSIDGAHVKEILDREVVLETRAGEIKLKIPS